MLSGGQRSGRVMHTVSEAQTDCQLAKVERLRQG